jgi:hypothetical protein
VRRRGSHIFYTIGSQMAVRLSALRSDCPLFPGRFLVVISVRGSVDLRAIVRLEGLCKLKKKSNYLIGNGTHDLLFCNIVPQPTTLPRALQVSYCVGRAIAQRLVAGLPPRRPGVPAQVKSCGICGGQSGTGAGFLRVLRFDRQFSFHRLFHIHNQPGLVQ